MGIRIRAGMVVVDKREEKGGVPALLKKLGISVRYEFLEVGDYALPGDILIERKTARDLVSSILDGRLFDQASNLSSASENPTFLVEGDLREALEEFGNENAVWGALASLVYDFRLALLYTPGPEETAALLAVLSRRKGERREITWLKPRRRREGLKEIQLTVLSALPGIGPATAQRLLEHLGSLRAVFDADPGQLSRAGRLPLKKSLEIHRIINARYGKASGSSQSKIDVF